jgi:hypothetical protein
VLIRPCLKGVVLLSTRGEVGLQPIQVGTCARVDLRCLLGLPPGAQIVVYVLLDSLLDGGGREAEEGVRRAGDSVVVCTVQAGPHICSCRCRCEWLCFDECQQYLYECRW